jgi:hypothetical protein
MGDRYHYDKQGNYTGMSSNRPPAGGGGMCGCFLIILLVILGPVDFIFHIGSIIYFAILLTIIAYAIVFACDIFKK